MRSAGCDPGMSGALAWLETDGGKLVHLEVHDMPLQIDQNGKKDYDYIALGNLVRQIPAGCPVTLELADSFKKDFHVNAFGNGKGYGAIRAALGSVGIKPRLVRPRSWKSRMLHGIANDKKMEAQALIARMHPFDIRPYIYGQKGGLKDGRVDAIFMALDGLQAEKLSRAIALGG